MPLFGDFLLTDDQFVRYNEVRKNANNAAGTTYYAGYSTLST